MAPTTLPPDNAAAADDAATGLLPVDPVAWWESVDTDVLMSYGVKAAGALALLIVGWIIARIVGGMVLRGLRKARIDETLGRFFGKMTRWAILLFVVLGCVGMFGIDVTSFAAVIAAMGFAIGLAFQGTLSNFSSGIMLLIFRPFKVGDVVNVAGQTGKVYEIDLFSTMLDTPDNRRIILPNASVFGSTIENISHHDTRRVAVAVGTAYDADIDTARDVLLKAATGIEGILGDPEPAVVLTGLGASSIDWSVRVWVNAADFFPVTDALTRAVKYALDDAGIGIPFPQMDIYVQKND
jgi:small conductance mechanosensitive channel